jgi:hypothetical protein
MGRPQWSEMELKIVDVRVIFKIVGSINPFYSNEYYTSFMAGVISKS